MSVITKGKTFANGEQLTAGKLNQMLDAAVFSSAAVDNTKTTLSAGAITIAPDAITITEVAQSFLDKIYPVGSIYTNATNGTNPGTLLGFGTWVSFGAGRVPVGIDSSGSPDPDFDTVEETGGVKEVTLTSAQSGVPAHSHLTVADADALNNGLSGSEFIAKDNTLGNPSSGSSNTIYRLGGSSTTPTLGPTADSTAANATSAHTNLQPYIVVYMWKRTA